MIDEFPSMDLVQKNIELLENYGKLNQERISEIANNFKLGLSNENVCNKNTLFTNVMMADLIMESSNNLDFKNEILKVKMDYCTQAVDAYKDFKGNNAEVENKNVFIKLEVFLRKKFSII